MSTQLEVRDEVESVTETDDPIVTHIIERDEKESAQARITRARVNGTAVTALCGYVWVPSRNPENHPLCQKCADLFEMAKDLRR